MSVEAHEARLKKLRMRSWRRGMKEMDLILGPFADRALAEFSADHLADYERLLEENDQDLYLWVTGAQPAPTHLAPLLSKIATSAGVARAD